MPSKTLLASIVFALAATVAGAPVIEQPQDVLDDRVLQALGIKPIELYQHTKTIVVTTTVHDSPSTWKPSAPWQSRSWQSHPWQTAPWQTQPWQHCPEQSKPWEKCSNAAAIATPTAPPQ